MTTNSSGKAIDKPFGEVIFLSSEMVIAQCYKESISNNHLKQPIIQGSTARVISSYDNSFLSFGLITKINNTSLDSIHKPSALGLSPTELEHLQPQVYDLLRKELEIYLFAYKEKEGEIFNYPPVKPMMIHDTVYQTSKEETIKLSSFEGLSSLINLIKKNQLKPDLLINLINEGYKHREDDYSYLVKTGQLLSLAFSDEIESLMQVLNRLSPKKFSHK